MRKSAREYYQEYVQYESLELSILNEFDFDGSRILDVGCGTGEALYHIGGRYRPLEGLGIDSSSQSIAYALQRNSSSVIQFICADMSTASIPADCFDYVLSIGVLHYYPYQEVCANLQKMTLALKKEGRIILFIFKPHVVHWIRRLAQVFLVSTGAIKLIERMGNISRRNVIINVVNPAVFYTYSVRRVEAFARECGLSVEMVVTKPTHVLPYFLPFGKKVSATIASMLGKVGVLRLLSAGNYYVLKKGIW